MDPSRGVFFILSTRRDRARMRIRITESVTASAGAVEGASCKKSFARSMEGPISLVSFAAGIGMSVRMALMAQSWFLGLHNRNGKIRNTVVVQSTSPLMQLGLILLACVAFMAVGMLLVFLKPRSHIGQLAIDRVLNAQVNWQKETLRSFVEVWVWICVNWYAFSASRSIMIAVLCATMTGVCVVGIGEYLAEGIRKIETMLRGTISDREAEDNSQYLQSGSMMVCVMYGYSVFSVIFDNVADITVACLLAATAGALLLFVAKLLAMYEPTRRAGELLTRRILNTPSNWRRHTMRSALESTAWFGLVVANFASYGNLMFAFQTGTVGGVLICLAGEYLTPTLYASDRDSRERSKSGTNYSSLAQVASSASKSEDAHNNSIGDFFPWLTFTYTVAAVIVLTSERWSVLFGQRLTDLHWGSATALYTVTGGGYVILGKVFMSMPGTRYVGKVLTDRFLNTHRNWETQTLRSLTETAFWMIVPVVGHLFFKNVFITVISGTVAGITGVLVSTVLGWGPSFASCNSDSVSLDTDSMESHKTHKERRVRKKTKKLRSSVYEWSEISKHNRIDDCWIVIRGIVYDVTTWGPKHPGGSIIFKYGGKDCTDQFDAFHRKHVNTRLGAYKIGTLSQTAYDELEAQTSEVTRAYRELSKKLWDEGFFNPEAGYYAEKHAVWICFMVLAVAIIFSISSSVTRCILGGMMLGMGWQQAAFLAHDALHNAVELPKKGGGINVLGWLMGSPIFGISSGMWLEEHNMHHAITLRPREDPQFNYLPLFLISEKELDAKVPQGFAGTPGKFHMNCAVRALISIQHYTFLPLCVLVGRFNLYAISIFFAIKDCVHPSTHIIKRKRALADLVGMGLFWAWHCALIVQFESVAERVLFVCASHFTVGILHVQLLLSHLATSTFTEKEEEAIGFFAFQLGTSRNIECMRYEHWFHGGLEYQIEHHLFPQLPRHNLHKVRPFVKEICRKHGIEYREVGFFAAVSECLSDFKRLAGDILTLEMG